MDRGICFKKWRKTCICEDRKILYPKQLAHILFLWSDPNILLQWLHCSWVFVCQLIQLAIIYYRNNHSYYRNNASCTSRSLKLLQQEQPYLSQALSRKKMTGGINGGLLNEATLKSLDFKRDFLFPLSLLLHNTRPVDREVLDGYSFSTSLLFSFLYSPDSFIYYYFFFRILYSFSLLSCFWQIFLSHFSHYFSSIGFLLVLSLLYCLFFLYPCFLHSLQAWMPYSAGNLEEPHLLVYIHYGMRHPCLTL